MPTKSSNSNQTQSMTQDFTVKFLKIEKLKEGEWIRWSREVKMSLHAQKAWKYIDPTTLIPIDKDEKVKWNKIHDQLVGALGNIVDLSLQRELESITEAPKAWLKLKEKTHSHGIISKLESISTAIRTRFLADVPFSKTITEIWDAVAAVLEGTAPTKDEWCIILLLNALSDGQYDWLRKDLLTFMGEPNKHKKGRVCLAP
ncbi:hypothetical protein K439DRAFT_1623491 [Ramaria rubella]|nr:hypothetical protein K439DRAFT_1623491 [Ramaria rubella]